MERKINPCLCGGDVEIAKRRYTSGMDGCYEDWEFDCKKCGGSWSWAADDFYGRKSYTKDDVIDIWNKLHADKESENATNGDVFKETFPDVDVQEIRGHFGNTLLGYRTRCGERSQDFLLDWWDATYKNNK